MKDKIIELLEEIAEEFFLVLLSEEIVDIATRIMELTERGEKYPIALITPYKDKFDQWVRDFGIDGQEYTFVNSIQHIRGRYFSAIQPGLSAWEVDPDIVDAARYRVMLYFHSPVTPKAVTDGEISQLNKLFEEFMDLHPYKEAGNADSYSQYNEGWSDACDVIESAVLKWMREQQGKGWISVEDRLPELHESVIISKPSDFPDKVYVGWLSEKGRWYEEDGPDGIANVEVCHWMPLPNPPKDSTDKQ